MLFLNLFLAAAAVSPVEGAPAGPPTSTQCEVARIVVRRLVHPGQIFETLPPDFLGGARPDSEQLLAGWTAGKPASFAVVSKFEDDAAQRSAFECAEAGDELHRLGGGTGTFTPGTPDLSVRFVRVSLPAIAGDEALVYISSRVRGLGSADELLLLRRNSVGGWAVTDTRLLGIS